MKDLIARYDGGLRARIIEIVSSVEAAGTARPAYAIELRAVKILPPIVYPTTMLNVAVNYREHDLEMAKLREQVPGMGAATSGAALRRRLMVRLGLAGRPASAARFDWATMNLPPQKQQGGRGFRTRSAGSG